MANRDVCVTTYPKRAEVRFNQAAAQVVIAKMQAWLAGQIEGQTERKLLMIVEESGVKFEDVRNL